MIVAIALSVLSGLSVPLAQGSPNLSESRELETEEQRLQPALAAARIEFDRLREARETGDHERAATSAEEVVRLLSLPELGDAHVELLLETAYLAYALARPDLARRGYELVVEHRERTLPPDHPDLLTARNNLAHALAALGDLAGARTVQEEVLRAHERNLPSDDPAVLVARTNLAETLRQSGDLEGARALHELVVRARERTLPESHPDLRLAREHLAVVLMDLNELDAAITLQERALAGVLHSAPHDHAASLRVRRNLAAMLQANGEHSRARSMLEELVAELEAAVPAHHPSLLAARHNLAAALRSTGDLEAARAHQETILASLERTLPTEHPRVLAARGNLAGTMVVQGDLAAARALQEDLLAILERALPEGHPRLLTARGNLALTLAKLGDSSRARALQEEVLEALESVASSDHPPLLVARGNLALTLLSMGSLEEARALQESVLEAYLQRFGSDHPAVSRSRGDLALTLREQGDLAGARRLQESVLESLSEALPADHPDVARARENLAMTLWAEGELTTARGLLEATLEWAETTLPASHPDRMATRTRLAVLAAGMGDRDVARVEAMELAREMLDRLVLARGVSAREAGEWARIEAQRFSTVFGLAECGAGDSLRATRFELAETLRAASVVEPSTVADSRRAELQELRTRLNDLVGTEPDPNRSASEFATEISRLTLERDRLEREIRSKIAGRTGSSGAIRLEALARSLPRGSAAAGISRGRKWALDPRTRRVSSSREVLVARVLRPDGTLTELDLGLADEVAELVETWRASLGRPVLRGVGVESDTAREREAGERLRALVLDPILSAAGEDTESLHLAVDDALHLVPLDALPTGTDGRVGDNLRLVSETSFVRLMTNAPAVQNAGNLLIVGGAGFDAVPEASAATIAGTSARTGTDGRSIRMAPFPPLLQTRFEAEAVLALFEEAFSEDADSVLLTKTQATKAAFREHAPRKRFVHVATHGWFAPETIPSTLDTQPETDKLWSRLGARETVTGLAPMTLCGLAFAGANHGRDSLGRVPGILTAEELAGIDLSACELAVLSACETNVGIRRAGQGIQSLQTALHAAGARTAITSLWKVDDAATRTLFERFYTYLWVDGMGKADALWKAKCDLRAEGHPVRDWAAWVLSGDPD